MKFENNRLIIGETPVNPKKITGTRFASIFGLNPYSTPFQVWSEICHVYESPFEDTKYTLAGKAIEPKQAEYIRNTYTQNIVYPKDLFGENYFNSTHGNFFTDEIFGGMWDYLEQVDGNTQCVFEMKTTGKSKATTDWGNGRIPEYYALQAALYAWLLHVDKVVMVATFLNAKDGDYDHPENFIVNDGNTKLVEFKISERYPTFEETYIKPAVEWWNTYVLTGVSPEFDVIQDAEVINTIKRTNQMEPDKSLEAKDKVDNSAKAILDTLDEIVKSYTGPLDELMLAIQDDIIAVEDPPLNLVERYFLEISNAIYFISSKVERLAVYDGMGKLNFKEKYNDIYLDSLTGTDGKKRTAAELTALAENGSKSESVINDLYNKAYKIIRAKVDAAQTMCATLSKVYSIKSQQAQADISLERQNTRQILNEGVYYN